MWEWVCTCVCVPVCVVLILFIHAHIVINMVAKLNYVCSQVSNVVVRPLYEWLASKHALAVVTYIPLPYFSHHHRPCWRKWCKRVLLRRNGARTAPATATSPCVYSPVTTRLEHYQLLRELKLSVFMSRFRDIYTVFVIHRTHFHLLFNAPPPPLPPTPIHVITQTNITIIFIVIMFIALFVFKLVWY